MLAWPRIFFSVFRSALTIVQISNVLVTVYVLISAESYAESSVYRVESAVNRVETPSAVLSSSALLCDFMKTRLPSHRRQCLR